MGNKTREVQGPCLSRGPWGGNVVEVVKNGAKERGGVNRLGKLDVEAYNGNALDWGSVRIVSIQASGTNTLGQGI
jgi:hypothetical protein